MERDTFSFTTHRWVCNHNTCLSYAGYISFPHISTCNTYIYRTRDNRSIVSCLGHYNPRFNDVNEEKQFINSLFT